MSKQRRKSRFGSNVVEDVERRKKAGSNYGYLNLPKGVNLYKEKAGRFLLDVIPYIVTDEKHPDANPDKPDTAHVGNPWYKRPIYVHRGIGVDRDSVVCPRTVHKKCPICEDRERGLREGADKDDVVGKAQLRNIYCVIPLENKDYEEKIHIWDISNGNFQSELDEELGEKPENGRFPDPSDEGLTLNVRFTEESFAGNKYFSASRIDFEERDYDYPDSIMDEAPNLDEIFTVLDYKELAAKYFEMEEDDIETDKEEDTPRSSRRRKKHADEEEEKPSRRRRSRETDKEEPSPRRRRRTDDEPEPEETEPEETEPEETPKRRSRRSEPEEEEKPKRSRRRSDDSPECPYDHKFGDDWDSYADCDDCKLFDACGEAYAEQKNK